MVLRNIESILLIEDSCPAFHTQYSLAQTEFIACPFLNYNPSYFTRRSDYHRIAPGWAKIPLFHHSVWLTKTIKTIEIKIILKSFHTQDP